MAGRDGMSVSSNAVSATQVRQGAPTGALGLDHNVGQATDSTGTVYQMTDTMRLAAKSRCKQRHVARKHRGSIRHRRIGEGRLRKRREALPWGTSPTCGQDMSESVCLGI